METRGGRREGAGRKSILEHEKVKRNSPFQIPLTKEELKEVKERFYLIKSKVIKRENVKYNYEVLEIILEFFEKNY